MVKLISSAEEIRAPNSNTDSRSVFRLRIVARVRLTRMTIIKISPNRLNEIPGTTPQNKKSAAKTVRIDPVIERRSCRGESFGGSGGGNDVFMDGVFCSYFVTQSFMAKF